MSDNSFLRKYNPPVVRYGVRRYWQLQTIVLPLPPLLQSTCMKPATTSYRKSSLMRTQTSQPSPGTQKMKNT